MSLFIDARAPVWLDGAERPDAAYLIGDEREAPAGAAAVRFSSATTHPPGCACCASRSEAAAALARLFHDRARGRVPDFRCVVVRAAPAGCEAARQAVAADPLASAYFRLG